jgi:hypothetical protein
MASTVVGMEALTVSGRVLIGSGASSAEDSASPDQRKRTQVIKALLRRARSSGYAAGFIPSAMAMNSYGQVCFGERSQRRAETGDE